MPVTLSDDDLKFYKRMSWFLHSMTYSLTTGFLEDETSREKIKQQVHKLAEGMTSGTCPDDLCWDKEKGCIPCSDRPNKKL
jgi:hypothetical protein